VWEKAGSVRTRKLAGDQPEAAWHSYEGYSPIISFGVLMLLFISCIAIKNNNKRKDSRK